MRSDAPRPRHGAAGRTLHWLVVVAIAAQFAVGWAMDEVERLVVAHVVLGVSILVLATIRVWWRRRVTLPPWPDSMTRFEQRLAHRTEQALYWLQFLIPLTGLALLLASGEDWDLGTREWEAPVELADDDAMLAAHVATHVAFAVALLAHVGLVAKRTVVDRDGFLRRML